MSFRLFRFAVAVLLCGSVAAGCAGAGTSSAPVQSAPPSTPVVASMPFEVPAEIDGIRRTTNAEHTRTARRNVELLTMRFVPQPTSTIAELYVAEERGDSIDISAVAGPVQDPAAAVRNLMATEGLQGVRPVNPGRLGGVAACGTLVDETRYVVTACSWADSGSVGMLGFVSPDKKDRSADFAKYRERFQRVTATPQLPG